MNNFPRSAKGECVLAATLYQAGQRKQAITVLERAKASFPKNSEVRHRLLELYVEEGMTDAAIEECRQLVKENPKDLVALDTMAVLCLRRGMIPTVAAILKRLIALCPLETRYQLLQAALQQQIGELGSALERYLLILETEQEESLRKAAKEAIHILDMVQLHQILTRATEDSLFRLKLKRDLESTLEDNGFHLSQWGHNYLRSIDLDALKALPSSPVSPDYYH